MRTSSLLLAGLLLAGMATAVQTLSPISSVGTENNTEEISQSYNDQRGTGRRAVVAHYRGDRGTGRRSILV